MCSTFQCALMVVGSLLVSGFINPWVFVPTLPLIILFIMVRKVFLQTSRDVKRLESTGKTTSTPYHQHHLYTVIQYLYLLMIQKSSNTRFFSACFFYIQSADQFPHTHIPEYATGADQCPPIHISLATPLVLIVNIDAIIISCTEVGHYFIFIIWTEQVVLKSVTILLYELNVIGLNCVALCVLNLLILYLTYLPYGSAKNFII